MGPIPNEEHWSVSFENKEYYAINTFRLSGSSLKILHQRLIQIVPTRIFGDGLDQYTDYIVPGDAEDWDGYCAAKLLADVTRRLNTRNQNQKFGKPFRGAIAAAREYLAEIGYSDCKRHRVALCGEA